MRAKHQFPIKPLAALLAAAFCATATAAPFAPPTQSTIIRDGSLGTGPTTALTVSGQVFNAKGVFNKITIPESYGKRVGGNVFQSFSQFNVASGEGAVFTLDPAQNGGITNNVISRVTGGSASSINGLLSLDPTGTNSKPNFFFINPAGVTFGAGSVVDVPAAFHVSTANYVRASDGIFYADTVSNSTFFSAAPEAFGFLGTTKATIAFQAAQGGGPSGSQMLTQSSNPVSIVGGDVTIQGSVMGNPGADLRIVALGKPSQTQEVGLTGALPSAHGTLNVTGTYVSLSPLPGLQSDGGSIRVSAGDITLNNAGFFTATQGGFTGKAGDVEINATGQLTMTGGVIYSNTSTTGNAGKVTVNAGSINISSGSYISSSSQGGAPNAGNAGDVTVNSTGNVTLDSTYISTSTSSAGHAADVKVTAGGDVKIQNGSYISSNAQGPAGIVGYAGNVTVTAGGKLTLDGTYISTSTYGPGHAGDVTVSSGGDIAVQNRAYVASDTYSSGAAGKVELTATGDVSILNSYVSSSTAGTGNAGQVKITGNNITIDGGNSNSGTMIASVVYPGGRGHAGDVAVTAQNNLSILNGAGLVSDTNDGPGYAGTVTVNAGSLSITGNGKLTGISSDTKATATGHAGDVSVTVTGDITMTNGGGITSSTYTAGDAGIITVKAGNLSADSQGGLLAGIMSSADTTSTGKAGSVDVNVTGTLSLSGTLGGITTSTKSSSPTGNAGTINVVAGDMRVQNNAQVSSDTYGPGNAGSVTINANTMEVLHGGAVSSATSGTGTAGSVNVTSNSLVIDSQGLANGTSTGISSDALTNNSGHAGDISVTANSLSIRNSGHGPFSGISSSTYGLGNAGTLTVNAGDINVDGGGNSNAGLKSDSLASSHGNAGNIVANATGSITLRNSARFSTQTSNSWGAAGHIAVNAKDVTIDNQAFLIAMAQGNSSGQTGDIVVKAGNSLTVSNKSEINIENLATVGALAKAQLRPTSISITAPRVSILNSPFGINARSTGNVDAGSIKIVASDKLYIDPSGIITQSKLGNGGAIDITTGFLTLDNSQIATSVTGLTGNGGNINITADTLLMQTGFIQANTAAANATGGNVAINVQLLVPTGNTLFLGGTTAYTYQPGVFGFNVIQAAAPTGVSGAVHTTSPSLDVSGTLVGLSTQMIDTGGLGRSPCQIGGGSSMVQAGRGGFAPSARDLFGPGPAGATTQTGAVPLLPDAPSLAFAGKGCAS